MFTKSLESTLQGAFERAKERHHEFMTVEHLLLALLDNPEANNILLTCGANLERLRSNLGLYIEETTPHLHNKSYKETQPTLGFQRVLQRAIFQVQAAGKLEVDGISVLIALFSEQDSQALHFLNQENVNRLDILNTVSQQSSSSTPTHQRGLSDRDTQDDPFMSPEVSIETQEETALERYAVNLNQMARQGRIDPLIGRQNELARCIQILSRRRKNNPLLIGDSGVGKTAIAEGLAKSIVEGNVPEQLAQSVIYNLDMGVLLAGTKYRGDFEKRFKRVLKELKEVPGAIVFIDEIHTLVGAGAASGGSMDASNLLKPILSSGDIRCMGATTYQEYRNAFGKDQALARRFQNVDVTEPSVEETVMILQGLKTRFESFHHIRYTDTALRSAAKLSKRYLTGRALPDTAIDLIDEAGAFQTVKPVAKRHKVITQRDIEDMVARIARIPSKQISESDKDKLLHLEKDLKDLVFGQDNAIETLCSAIQLSRSGLRDEHKPVGSFLFAGPTGVGKTEVTRQLANELGVELIRFDMSEYMEAHAVSRLIGAPPGYVGFEQGGLLTESINKQPHCVLLLDEIEKAHPDIFNILLQVMDHGSLTDNNGVSADFRHVILVMTSNAGASLLEKNTVGFMQSVQDRSESLCEINRLFAPEFRNRLDATVLFKHLTPSVLESVIDKFIQELSVKLKSRRVSVEITPSAKRWLAKNGYDRTMGARPMARLIEQAIKKPLASELLFGKLTKGGKARVCTKRNHLYVEVI